MFHDVLEVFHRWLGLVTALFIFLIALTGSALVFETGIDHVQHPELWKASTTGAALPYDSIAARASAAANGEYVAQIAPPLEEGRPAIATVGARQVFIDPHSGAVLGTRLSAQFNNSLPRRLHRLHVELLVRDQGRTVVALATVAALLLTITGIIIWWRDKRWQIQWRASWKRVVYDLHHSLGIIASLVLLIVTASGVVIHFNSIGAAIASMDSAPRPAPPKQPPASGVTTPIGFDSAARIAARTLPGARMTMISILEKPDQLIRIALRFPEDQTPGGRSRLYIDRFRGTVLGVENSRAAEAGTRLNNKMRSIHTGDIYGTPTRAIWFLCALILAQQSVSGLLMWWHQRPARLAAERRRKAP